MLYACDGAWWDAYWNELTQTATGEGWTVDAAARDRYRLRWVRGVNEPGLSKQSDRIHTGHNSGYQAICLAHLFGATRLLLLGFDFANSGTQRHWHGDHPRGLGNGGDYAAWIRAMNRLAQDLEDVGVEVINCSRSSALRCFRRQPIELS